MTEEERNLRETRIKLASLSEPAPSRSPAATLERTGEAAPDSQSPAALRSQVEFWRSQYDRERELLAKLWVLYQDAESQVKELEHRLADAWSAGRTEEPAKAAPPPIIIPTRVYHVEDVGPYRHGDYTLYAREVTLKNDRKQRIHFFSKKAPKKGEAVPLPAGFAVQVSPKTGLPFLRRTESEGTPEESPKAYAPQCAALAGSGDQCRNSSRSGSKYCASHKGYRPKTAEAFLESLTTSPKEPTVAHRAPAFLHKEGEKTAAPTEAPSSEVGAEAAQCEAVGTNGKQCRNTAHQSSKYCGVHKGYRPKSIRALLEKHDTKPRNPRAEDTEPTIRATP